MKKNKVVLFSDCLEPGISNWRPVFRGKTVYISYIKLINYTYTNTFKKKKKR